MKSLMTAVALTVSIGSQSVSACFFPFFPTYTAGYAPWGMGWGVPYRPVAFNYAPQYAPSYAPAANCGTGCGTYSAGFQGFNASQFLSNPISYGYGSGCNSCGNACGGGCGVIGNVVNYGGCDNGCGTECIGTETRKVPEADEIYNSDRAPRTFDGNRDDRTDRRDTRDRIESDGFRPRSDSDSGFGSRREDERDWNPSGPERNDRRNTRPEDRSIPGLNRSEFGEERGGFGSGSIDDDLGRPPLTSPNERTSPGSGGLGREPFEGFPGGGSGTERLNRKPEVDAGSVDAAPIEQSLRKPEMPDIEADDAGSATTEAPAPDANDKDFLPADETAFNRSSHFEILKMPRLAGRSTNRRVSATKVSSSRKKQLPPRWISIPMPAGRVRL